MNTLITEQEIDSLATRIRNLTAQRLVDPETQHGIERLARHDMRAANELWDRNVPPGVSELPFSKPSVLNLGAIVSQQYDDAAYQRQGRDFRLAPGQDSHIRHAEPGNEYLGPVVGRTDRFLVQQEAETGDFVLHKRKSLSGMDMSQESAPVKIRYPHGQVGLVSAIDRAAKQSPQWARELER